MTINLVDLFVIFGVHWVGDFVLQTQEQALNKSKQMSALLGHTGTYTLFWMFAGIFYIVFGNYGEDANMAIMMGKWVIFGLVTFATHTLIDYFTSRATKRYFDAGNYHNGFVVVGLDQILHYAQLILLYMYLK